MASSLFHAIPRHSSLYARRFACAVSVPSPLSPLSPLSDLLSLRLEREAKQPLQPVADLASAMLVMAPKSTAAEDGTRLFPFFLCRCCLQEDDSDLQSSYDEDDSSAKMRCLSTFSGQLAGHLYLVANSQTDKAVSLDMKWGVVQHIQQPSYSFSEGASSTRSG